MAQHTQALGFVYADAAVVPQRILSKTQREAFTFTTGVPDTTAPVVDNFSPANGATIAATDPIFFDTTDDRSVFARVLVAVTQGDTTELAHDGDNFLAPYDTLSTRTNITDGFRYRLRRDGGWVDTATVRVFAIDPSGNEAI